MYMNVRVETVDKDVCLIYGCKFQSDLNTEPSEIVASLNISEHVRVLQMNCDLIEGLWSSVFIHKTWTEVNLYCLKIDFQMILISIVCHFIAVICCFAQENDSPARPLTRKRYSKSGGEFYLATGDGSRDWRSTSHNQDFWARGVEHLFIKCIRELFKSFWCDINGSKKKKSARTCILYSQKTQVTKRHFNSFWIKFHSCTLR